MSVKIAFASADRKTVDQHFGAAEAFVIYELSEADARMVEAVEFHDSDTDPVPGHMVGAAGHEGKLAAKISLLAGCAAVYCNAVGASAIKQLLAAGIQPMKVEEGMPVDQLLCGLNQAMLGEPPVWLAKSMQTRDNRRFDAMDEEGWSE